MSDYQNFQSLSDYLEKARELGHDDRFTDAFDLLESALNLSPDMLGMGGEEQIETIKDELKRDRRARALELTGELTEIMQKPPEEVEEQALDAGETCLARLEPVHPDAIELDQLSDDWRDFRMQAETLREIREVQQQAELVWNNESKLNTVAFDRVHYMTGRLAEKYPDAEDAQRIFEEAKSKREEAYDFADERVTQADLGEYDALYSAMQAGIKAGAERLPFYEYVEGTLGPKVEVPSSEAIEQLAKLRRQSENKKIQEYIDRARGELTKFPEGALSIIQDAQKKFTYADQEEKDRLAVMIRDEIQPRITSRKLAQELAVNALKQASRDPEGAWDFLVEAKNIDRLTPEIETAEKVILPNLRRRLENLLKDAEGKRQTGDLEIAKNIIADVRKYSELAQLRAIKERADALAKECDDDTALLKSLWEDARKIEELADKDIAVAKKMLRNAEEKIIGRPAHFQQPLNTPRTILQERLSEREVLDNWRVRFESEDPVRISGFRDLSQERIDETELIEAKAMRASLQELEKEADKRSRNKEVKTLLQHIRGRLQLIQGRLDWKAGLYDGALQNWEDCIRLGNDDDVALAQKWKILASDATEVSKVLDDAKFRQVEELDFDGALNVLKPWLEKASPKQREVRLLYNEIKTDWSKKLVTEIDEDKDNTGRPLNAVALEERINTLRTIDPAEAQKYTDKLVAIYSDWAKKTPSIDKKIEYYKKAISIAGHRPLPDIQKELFWVQRKQLLDKLEHESRDNAIVQARAWIKSRPHDAVTRIAIIEWLLKREDNARTDIEMAERRFNNARQKKNPFEAGLADEDGVNEEWLKLKALEHQSKAMDEINSAQNAISSWLRPEKTIQDYNFAKNTSQSLCTAIEDRQVNMKDELIQLSEYQALHQEDQKRIREYWNNVRSWLNKQSKSNGEIKKWYNETERDLLNQLRDIWEKTPLSSPVRDIILRSAPPIDQQTDRWRTGLKIQFLNKGDEAGSATLTELGELYSKLNQEADDLVNDSSGPEYDLDHKALKPVETLQVQERWAQVLLQWAREINALYSAYGDDDDKDIATIIENLRDFYQQVVSLDRRVQQVIENLNRAKMAGNITFDSHSWQDVPWRKMVKVILRSGQATSIATSQHNYAEAYLEQLEEDDIDVRTDAWSKASTVLLDMQLDSHVEKAPWQDLNKIAMDAEIDERWEEALDPIAEVGSMKGHRVLKWLNGKKNHNQRTRNRLVLATTLLYALVQAERFTPALKQMEHMIRLDEENDFGFRVGQLIKDPEPLTWDRLHENLKRQKGQWEKYQMWWKSVESSALPVWRNVSDEREKPGRKDIIDYVNRAEYEQAFSLAVDALYGVDAALQAQKVYRDSQYLSPRVLKERFEGKLTELEQDLTTDPIDSWTTNTLGGGLALAPLRVYLEEQKPPEFESSLSRRMEQALVEVEQWLHDVKESINEIRFWLDGVKRSKTPDDLKDPVYIKQSEFYEKREELDGAIQALNSWRTLRKGPQREYCNELLEDLKRIAPEYSYEEYESLI